MHRMKLGELEFTIHNCDMCLPDGERVMSIRRANALLMERLERAQVCCRNVGLEIQCEQCPKCGVPEIGHFCPFPKDEAQNMDDEFDAFPYGAENFRPVITVKRAESLLCRCPVCNGKGLVPNGFYRKTTGAWATADLTPEKCRSCDGKGYVEWIPTST